MKQIKYMLSVIAIISFQSAFAQMKTESVPVAGNCGMCEGKIEKAAKKAGAIEADWNKSSKILNFKYDTHATSSVKIQQEIASVGYDTRDVKAPEAAYNQLPDCCKYARGNNAKAISKSKGGDDECADKKKHSNK